jgi:4'-phosphopantetheinyl transferase
MENPLFHNTSGEPSSEAWQVLTPQERARAARFHFERDRHRWVNGRAWVRGQLAARLACPAASLELAVEPGGRPSLKDYPGLDFNLSHTGDWIALVMCQEGRIGVDLETVDPTFPALEIAREFFLPAEHDWIAAGPVERFFHLWTAKEALMKATGRGMSLPPDKILVTIRNGRPETVTQLETGAVHPVTTRPGPGDTIVATVWLDG